MEVCGHVCLGAIVSFTVVYSSAVEQQPRRLTAHVQSPTKLVPQLQSTMTEGEIYILTVKLSKSIRKLSHILKPVLEKNKIIQ